MDNNPLNEPNPYAMDYQLYRVYYLALSRQREDIIREREELDRQQALLHTRRFYLEQEAVMLNRQLEDINIQGGAMYPHLHVPRPNYNLLGPYRAPGYPPFPHRYPQPVGRAAPGNGPNLRMPAPVQVSREVKYCLSLCYFGERRDSIEYAAGLGNCRACHRRAAVFSCQDHHFNYCSIECQVAGCFLFERQTAPPAPVEEMLVPRVVVDDNENNVVNV